MPAASKAFEAAGTEAHRSTSRGDFHAAFESRCDNNPQRARADF
jgi:hypothetical protein